MRAALDRPRLWRITAVLAALLLGGLIFMCSQGSLTIIARRPSARAAVPAPWERWCTRGTPRRERVRLAYCARVQGRVIDSTHGPNPDETHIAVIGDFHLMLVRLPNWQPTPSRGTDVVAIGPLFRARDGQREVQAFRYETT